MDIKREGEKTKQGEGPIKQWKVGITEKGYNTLNQYLEIVNKNSKRRIRVPEILEFAVEKLGEKDVRKIQERVYTSDDKMDLMLEEYNVCNPTRPLTLGEFKAHLLELYNKHMNSKAKKTESDITRAE